MELAEAHANALSAGETPRKPAEPPAAFKDSDVTAETCALQLANTHVGHQKCGLFFAMQREHPEQAVDEALIAIKLAHFLGWRQQHAPTSGVTHTHWCLGEGMDAKSQAPGSFAWLVSHSDDPTSDSSEWAEDPPADDEIEGYAYYDL